ncbi:hypothetical protein HK097_006864, partial [Rhizophlyctis rosea]
MTLLSLDSFLTPPPGPRPDATTTITNSINWALLAYLFGIFITLAGVSTTPLTSSLYSLFTPLLKPTPPNKFITTISFTTICLVVCLVFTSVPSVVLLTPLVKDVSGISREGEDRTW